MSSDSGNWNPKNPSHLTFALPLAVGEAVAIGETVRVEVYEVKGLKVRLWFNAREDCKILRAELIGRDEHDVPRARKPGNGSAKPGLCLTRRLGEWALIGDDTFVGVSAFDNDKVILGVKTPPGLLVCQAGVWDLLHAEIA
jgi:sRNA-binding carbon storage regulator CsrA